MHPPAKLFAATTEYESFKESLKMVVDGKAGCMLAEYLICVATVHGNRNITKGA